MKHTLRGRISTFGGPDDGPGAGNARSDWKSEGLALWSLDELPSKLRLSSVDLSLTGAARHLDPNAHYIAMRWNEVTRSSSEPADYDRAFVRSNHVIVKANGRTVFATPVDWGPASKTGRLADVSPGLANYLSLKTDDEAEFVIELEDEYNGPFVGDEAYMVRRPDEESVTRPTGNKQGGSSWVANLIVPLVVSALTMGGSKLVGLIVSVASNGFSDLAKRAFDSVVFAERSGGDKESKAVSELLGDGANALLVQVARFALGILVDMLNKKYGHTWLDKLDGADDGRISLFDRWLNE